MRNAFEPYFKPEARCSLEHEPAVMTDDVSSLSFLLSLKIGLSLVLSNLSGPWRFAILDTPWGGLKYLPP